MSNTYSAHAENFAAVTEIGATVSVKRRSGAIQHGTVAALTPIIAKVGGHLADTGHVAVTVTMSESGSAHLYSPRRLRPAAPGAADVAAPAPAVWNQDVADDAAEGDLSAE